MAKEVKVKAGLAYTKSGIKKISGTATTTKVATTKKPKTSSSMASSASYSKSNRKMNALDKAISQGKSLPSKNKKVPADTDVKMKGMKAKPVVTIKKSEPNKSIANKMGSSKKLEKLPAKSKGPTMYNSSKLKNK